MKIENLCRFSAWNKRAPSEFEGDCFLAATFELILQISQGEAKVALKGSVEEAKYGTDVWLIRKWNNLKKESVYEAIKNVADHRIYAVSCRLWFGLDDHHRTPLAWPCKLNKIEISLGYRAGTFKKDSNRITKAQHKEYFVIDL